MRSTGRDREIPLAWKKQADTLYLAPLRLAYDHLDPHATYSVRACLFRTDQPFDALDGQRSICRRRPDRIAEPTSSGVFRFTSGHGRRALELNGVAAKASAAARSRRSG